MTEPRTEGDGEAAVLDLRMGGKPYRLAPLPIIKSEIWQSELAAHLGTLTLSVDSTDGVRVMSELMAQGPRTRMDALVAYDVDEMLGGRTNIEAHMTKVELRDAMEVVLDAEYPFDTEGRHSVEEAFGLPMRVLSVAVTQMAKEVSVLVPSPSGLSPIGDSPTPTSEPAGPASNSSSAGATGSVASRKKRKPKG